MTSSQHIDYDALALEALRGVVKACLAQVARNGLVGEHHFYIAFNTQAAGVGMSKRLKEKYPVEMTIVLQHRFWDLLVDDERFEVKLTFDGIPERLVVPFSAVKVFYDPSVPYVLQFEESDPAGVAPGRRGPRRIGGPNGPVSARDPDFAGEITDVESDKPDRRKPTRKSRSEQPSDPVAARVGKSGSTSTQSDDQADTPQPVAPPAAAPVPQSGGKPAVAAVGKTDGDGEDQAQSTEENASDPGGAKIFDLSKFRGKK
ncbi:MAG: SspB family protein [Hyphomicrobiaceae bacterium]